MSKEVKKPDLHRDDVITIRSEAEAVRAAPEMYLPGKNKAGAQHTLLEIVGNAQDALGADPNALIEITYTNDNVVSVRDNGFGVPMGWNGDGEDPMYNWYAIYSRRDAGGKYSGYQDDLRQITDWSSFDVKEWSHLFSIGMFGVGASVTQFTSDFMDVYSYHGGVCTEMHFKNGTPVVPDEYATKDKVKFYEAPSTPTDEPDGTLVRWRPSKEVFSDSIIGRPYIEQVCQGVSYLGGMHIVARFQDESGEWETVDYPPQTIKEYNIMLSKKAGHVLGTPIGGHELFHGTTTGSINGRFQELIYVLDAEVSIIPVQSGGKTTVFHNGVPMKQGVHFDAVTNATQGFLRKLDGLKKMKDEECYGMFNVVIKTMSNYTEFEGNQKTFPKSGFIHNHLYILIENALKEALELKHPGVSAVIKRIQDKVATRLEREEERKMIREIKKNTSKKRKEDIEKWNPSTNYLSGRGYNEVYVVEGDSAAQQVLGARDLKTQSVMPTTGKPTNVEKVSDSKALSKQFIQNWIRINGAGVYVPSKPEESNYDPSKEKVDKFILLTDADIDGEHIRAMIVNFVSKFNPNLLIEGKIWICVPPLFKIMFVDGTHEFATNENDLQEFMANNTKQIAQIMYIKGIGEMTAEDVDETCMDPDKRKLVQIKLDPFDPVFLAVMTELFEERTINRKRVFSALLGEDLVELEEQMRLESLEINNDDDLEDDLDEYVIIV